MTMGKRGRRALVVGGCSASYHLLETVEVPLRALLESAGFIVEIDGIRHPEGAAGPIVGGYGRLDRPGLNDIDLVVLYTTGSGHGEDPEALVEFVNNGGGLVGIHCAADSFTDNAAWVEMLGGAFRTHPAPLEMDIDIVDSDHPVVAGIEGFTLRDELYFFRDFDLKRVRMLLSTGSASDPFHPDWVPVAWVREPGRGRVFYLSLGHLPEVVADSRWQELVRRGALWAVRSLPQPG